MDTPQICRLGWCLDYPDANNFIREVFIDGGSAEPDRRRRYQLEPAISYDDFEKIVLALRSRQDPAKRTEMYARPSRSWSDDRCGDHPDLLVHARRRDQAVRRRAPSPVPGHAGVQEVGHHRK